MELTRKEKLAKVLELMIAEKPWKKLFKEILREDIQMGFAQTI